MDKSDLLRSLFCIFPTPLAICPPDERQAIGLDDAELNNELLRMTDAHMDELFRLTPVEAADAIGAEPR